MVQMILARLPGARVGASGFPEIDSVLLFIKRPTEPELPRMKLFYLLPLDWLAGIGSRNRLVFLF